jgi:putative adenylate-forming enzyme
VGSLSILWQVRKLKRAQRSSPHVIEKARSTRFRRILKHALTNSRFYREYYGDHGINLKNAHEVPIERLPTVNKNIMMENFDDFVCDPKLKRADLEEFVGAPENRGRSYLGRYHVVHTSGSSGTIGLFIYDPGDWDVLMAMVLARVTRTRINFRRKIRMAYIGATDGNYAGISLAGHAPRILYRFLPLHINSPIEEIVTRIQEFQPDSISGYSSGVHILAREQIAGRLKISPKKIVCSADHLTPKIREAIRKAFDVEPIAFYAASESIAMAAECATHRGFHLFDDWHVFQLVDEQRHPVPAGKPGRMILTNLYNYTQPLIRYEMNDVLVLNERPCGCSWPSPTLQSIGGRSEDFLWFDRPDGTQDFIHPLVMVEFMVLGLRKIQVEQPERNRLILRSVIRGDPDEACGKIGERMREILESKNLQDVVEFDIEIVDRIENDPKTGKYRLIIPFKP